MNPVLSINQLSKVYGHHYAIKDVSFELHKGNVYGLLGPNGSGKSTTLGIVLGIINASRGSYKWFNDSDSYIHLRRVGAILENPNFYPYLSALENLKLVADIKYIKHEKIEEKLKLVDLFDRRFDKFSTYSLGMKQRLAIASAMLNDPEVLILDEPTNGLDPKGIHEIRELITKIASNGTTILLASHLLDEVEKICNHVIVLKKGQILYSGKIGSEEDYGTLHIAANDMQLLQNELSTYDFIGKIDLVAGSFQAKLKEKVTGDQVVRLLVEKNVFPTMIKIDKQRLEDKFLELTNSN